MIGSSRLAAMKTRIVQFLVVSAAALLLAHALDGMAYRHVRVEDIYGEDWGRLLRIMGFLPTWLAVGIALMLEDRTAVRDAHRSRGGLLIAGAIAGGVVAELGKLLIRRLRPGDTGEYAFRSFADRTFSTGGLAMPSSHALVAFGAAAVLSRLFPRAWWIWWGLAAGCGLSRVAAGAHFLSDVVLAAILGWLVGAWVWGWRGTNIAPARRIGASAP